MENNHRLKETEKAIISKLELNSRIPYSRFGKGIKKSQQQISYTVNSLIKKEIINNFFTLIDYSKLNVLHFRVYFKVNYVKEKKFEDLIKYLMSEPHTAWIVGCGGRHDLICTFFAWNPSQFNKVLRRIMEKFPEQINNCTILTTIVKRRFGRKYLFKNPDSFSQIIIGGDREPIKIDDMDLKILSELSSDARKNSVAIGNSLGLSSKSIIQRIKKLQEKKIIRGFKTSFDHSKLGHSSKLLVIKYHNISSEVENELINYLKTHLNVTSLTKTIGEWDLEIELESPDERTLRKIEIELRQKFALLIQQIESIPLYKPYKLNYFPKFLLEKEKRIK